MPPTRVGSVSRRTRRPCDNTDDMLAIDPRPGNATANCADDNIALLDEAVSRLPGPYRHNVLVRLDRAGFSHDLLTHIASGAGWETGPALGVQRRLVVHRQGNRRHRTSPHERLGARDRPRRCGAGGHLRRRPNRSARGQRLDPRHPGDHPGRTAAPPVSQTATDQEKKLDRRYQLIATNTKVRQIAWLDARHRSHVHVENDVKQAKALGLNRWPSRH